MNTVHRALMASFALFLSLAPSRAHAYLEGTRFLDPALEGGAGGRLFTGAPRDGYGCAVCHAGGATPDVRLEGLPEDGWDPGQTYELSLVFPMGARSTGAVLEVADARGDGVGELVLVPDAELEDADRCRDMGAAVTLAPITGRLVARADVCGASRARVRWTAPAAPVSDVRLFFSAVVADDSGDPSGDAAITDARTLRARGAPDLEGGRLGQRCSASVGESPVPWGVMLFLVAFLARRTRRVG